MKSSTILIAFAISLPLAGFADIISHYAFNGSTYADSAGFAGVAAGDLVRGAGTTSDSNFSTFSTPVDGGSHSFFIRGSGLNVADNATAAATVTATSQGNYVEFTLNSSGLMNLTSLTLDAAKNAGNNHSMRLLVTSDITGHLFDNRLDIISPAAADTSLANVIQSNLADNLSDSPNGIGIDWGVADNTTINLSVPAFQNISDATFRIYAFTIANGSPSNANVMRLDNIIVNGTVVPEPASLSLLLIGALIGRTLRRR